jgi:hypothetical protein
MSFLSLSGIPLLTSSLRYQPTHQGTKGRTFSGFPYSSVRRTLMTWAGSTPPTALAESWAARQLINGAGHSWHFETGTVSSLGLMPSATTGTVTVSLGGAKFGNGKLSITNGDITWPLTAEQGCTYGAWMKAPSIDLGAQWRHVVVRLLSSGDQRVYVDGTLVYNQVGDYESDTAVYLPGDGAAFRIGYASGPDTLLVDDLVFLPFMVPESWLVPWRDAGAPFGPLPYHRCTGTGLHRSPVTVLGDARDGEAVEFFNGGTHVQGETFDFELREVP